MFSSLFANGEEAALIMEDVVEGAKVVSTLADNLLKNDARALDTCPSSSETLLLLSLPSPSSIRADDDINNTGTTFPPMTAVGKLPKFNMSSVLPTGEEDLLKETAVVGAGDGVASVVSCVICVLSDEGGDFFKTITYPVGGGLRE